MPDPTVCAVLLTRDRPAMARQAVECFRRQTYERKRLLVVNSGMGPLFEEEVPYLLEPCFVGADVLTIGGLRNLGCQAACENDPPYKPDIFMHFDDDDISHPARIAEQVALLQASGADCVGYREALFWRIPSGVGIAADCRVCGLRKKPRGRSAPLEMANSLCDHECEGYELAPEPGYMWPGETAEQFGYPKPEAFLYTNTDPTFCLGTSMCYWRKTWERNPFSERNGPNPRERGEDREFLRGIKSVGVSSVLHCPEVSEALPGCEPRMVCRIHAGNAKHYPEDLLRNSPSWRRVPEWDEKCREVCA